MNTDRFILTTICENRPGIVAAVWNGAFEMNCDIFDSQQFDNTQAGKSLARIVLNHLGLGLPANVLLHGCVAAMLIAPQMVKRGAVVIDVSVCLVLNFVSMCHRKGDIVSNFKMDRDGSTFQRIWSAYLLLARKEIVVPLLKKLRKERDPIGRTLVVAASTFRQVAEERHFENSRVLQLSSISTGRGPQ